MEVVHFILNNWIACYLASFIITMIGIYFDNKPSNGFDKSTLKEAIIWSFVPVFNIFLVCLMLCNIIFVNFKKIFKTNLYIKLNNKFMGERNLKWLQNIFLQMI
jgi:hypothetical protein